MNIIRDFKFAFRQLLKAPAFTIAAADQSFGRGVAMLHLHVTSSPAVSAVLGY